MWRDRARRGPLGGGPLRRGFPECSLIAGRLMTGSRGHSESERAGAALQAAAPPLIRPLHAGRTAGTARRHGGRRLPGPSSIHSSLHPSHVHPVFSLCCPDFLILGFHKHFGEGDQKNLPYNLCIDKKKHADCYLCC